MESNTTIEIISVVLNFILASGLVGTLLFFRPKKRKEYAEADSAELRNTEQIVALQSKQITRLDGRVEKLEEKVDKLTLIIETKDTIINESNAIIRQTGKCPVAQQKGACPVLVLKEEVERKRKKRIEEGIKREKEESQWQDTQED